MPDDPAGVTADDHPLSGKAADRVTFDRLEDMDDCPECGGTFGHNRRRHVCIPVEDRR